MKRCIVTVGVMGHYPASVRRLEETRTRFSPNIPMLPWIDEYPPGSPTHQNAQYVFKTYAIKEAEKRGYDSIMWADSSMVAVAPLEPAFERTEREGVTLFHSDRMGTWSSDASLSSLGMTRDVAMDVAMVAGTAFLVCLSHPTGREFFDRLFEFAEHRREVFCGEWNNNGNCVSSDPRCLGHRHDQTVLSFIAYKMKLPILVAPELFCYWNGQTDKTVMCARGWGQP